MSSPFAHVIMLRKLPIIAIFIVTVLTASGCRLIFEPDVDAITRLFSSMPIGDNRVVRELCDGEDVCRQMNALYGLVKSDWYNAQKGFYEIKRVEIAEDTGYSYVYVDIKLRDSSTGRENFMPLVFEMERIKLRWHVYSVNGLPEFLRRAERERGIL